MWLPALQSAGSERGWQARALRLRLCPSDQTLRHRVGNCRRVAAALGALRPDLLKAYRDALDPLPNQAGIAVADIFGADVDDAARVDHIIGRIENAALVQTLAVFRGRELVVRAARNDRGLEGRNRLLGKDRSESVRTDDVRLEPEDLVRGDDGAAGRARKLLRLCMVNVGNAQARAFRACVESDTRGDASSALHRDVQAIERILAQCTLHCCLDAEEH